MPPKRTVHKCFSLFPFFFARHRLPKTDLYKYRMEEIFLTKSLRYTSSEGVLNEACLSSDKGMGRNMVTETRKCKREWKSLFEIFP
jgi:hypothetical protein